NFERLNLNHVVRMAIRQNQIGIAVVIVIEETQTPAAEQTRCRPNLAGPVDEGQIFFIVIETEQFLIDIGDEQILPTVVVVIGRIDAHSRTRRTRIAVSDSGQQTDFFKLSLPFIDEKKVCEGVVRNKEIHQAIVVYVSRDGAKRFAE